MPRPARTMEKSKDFKGSMKKLIKSLKSFHVLLIISLVLAMASAILALVSPNKLSDLTNEVTLGITPNISEEVISSIMSDDSISAEDKLEFSKILEQARENTDNKTELLESFDELPTSIYDKIKPSIDMKKVENIALLLVILYLISALFSYIEGILMTVVSNGYAKNLRTNISKKINKLPLKYFDSHETGDILSRVTNDVDTIATNLNQSLTTLVTSITLFIGSIIMMFTTNWIMALTAIVSSLIGFSFMGLILGKSQKYFTERQTELGNLIGYIEEIYSGHNVVKAYNGDKEARENFEKLNDKLFVCNQKSQFLSGLMPPMMSFVGNLGYVAVCVVGALLTMNNTISFGVIVAFMIYVRLFTNPMGQMAQAMTSLQSTVAASERVFEFLNEEEMSDQKHLTKYLSKDSVKGEI